MRLRIFTNLFLISCILYATGLSAQETTGASATVKGRVTSAEDGEVIPGVSILVKGTTIGTVTDVNGQYVIQVPGEAPVLIFSNVGYTTEEVILNGRSVVDLVLIPSIQYLNEMVVTALGISREESSLGFAVGQVDGEELNRVAQENVINGIAGKVPGVTISSTGAAGSSVSMVIRGATSLSGDNQPLFVVDGVPVVNTLNNVTEIGSRNPVDYGNAISDLNPEDIESVSVLKGPSAAALYGSRAGNGVVLITTKSGKKAKRLTVSVHSNTVFDKPFKYLPFHTQFATGVQPYTEDSNPYPGGQLLIDEGSAAGSGPELDIGQRAIQWNSPLDENGNPIPTELVSYEDNVKNFVRTGITTTNGISLSNSNDMIDYRLGFTNMTSRGIIPNSDLFRNNISLASSTKLSEKIVFSNNINVNRSWSNNRPSGNRGTNPLQHAYALSPHIDIRELRDYWVPGQEGLQQRSPAIGDKNNPYFLAYEINNSFQRDRVYGNLKADWQITPEFDLMVRYALDYYDEKRETKGANSYTREGNGIYGVVDLERYERNVDFLATYRKKYGDFDLTLSAGGNARYNRGTQVRNATKSRGAGLVVPGVFTIQNIAPTNLDFSNSFAEQAVHSLYGIASLGFKDMIYLDVTARNDWSSTLPKENRSYFYPSTSLSVLLDQALELPSTVDLLKIRGGWAQVGNDTNPYSLFPTLQSTGAWGDLTRLSVSGNLLTPDLKPEIATSWEVGADLKMFGNRLWMEATYYEVENENQVLGLGLPPSSGFDSKTINAGLIKSTGWEFMLGGTPIQQNGWIWNVSANISRNRTKILELSDGIEFFRLWNDAKGGAWTYVGDEIGDIYDRELVTVTDESSPYFGYPLLNEEGSWQDIRAENTRNKIGNFNPDFLLGFQTSVSYKNFTLSATVDWRKGGQFVSQTYRYSESDLKTQRFLDNLINPGDLQGDALRDWLVANADTHIKDGINIVGGPTKEYGGFPTNFIVPLNDGVFNPGVIATYDNEGNITGYIENLGGPGTRILPYADNYPWDFTKAAMFDADFVKLREISLSYQLPSEFVKNIGLQNASVGVYSRNIILWTKAKVGIDPEMAFQPGPGVNGSGSQFKQGIERYNITPWVIPVGFKLGVTF